MFCLTFSDHSYSPCKITSPFNSDLVTASFEEVLSGTGCVTNRTVPKTGAEVHAINYHSDRAQRVELYLKDNSNNGKVLMTASTIFNIITIDTDKRGIHITFSS